MAESLRLARVRAGYSLDQLAACTELSKAYLSRLEAGERQPSLATLLSLSRELGVPTSVLLGERPVASPLRICDADGPTHTANGLTIESCSGFTGSRVLEAIKISIEPDRPPASFASHRGEE